MGIIFVRKINVHSAVFQLVVGAQQEIGKEQLQKLCGGMNAFLQIVIIRSNKCVAEIPGVFTEGIVIHTETEGFHILNHKHGGGSRIALPKGMNLPNIRGKFGKMLYRCLHRQSLVGELLFVSKVIV